MTNKEKQKYIDSISTKMRFIAEERDENLQFEYDVLKLALAALTAQPVKLPTAFTTAYASPGCDERFMRKSEVIAAIRAAGYQVEGK